jgi:hypothetical protein
VNPYLKLAIFLIATFFIVTKVGTADYSAEDVATWKRWDWFQLVIGIGAALFTQALAFVDNSLARWLDERKATLNPFKEKTNEPPNHS